MIIPILLALFLLTTLFFNLTLANFMKKTLGLLAYVLQHHQSYRFARLAIGSYISELHNGKDLKPYTLEKAFSVITKSLTDLLQSNGYEMRDWNPYYLIHAALGTEGLIHELKAALKLRTEQESCQDSTSGTPPTHTPD